MNKPMTIAYSDFKRALTELINNSGLYAFTIESVLNEFLQEIHEMSQSQLNEDIQYYMQAMRAEQEDKAENLPSDEEEMSDEPSDDLDE